jgi:putative NADH-flavin reductase
MSIKNVAVIGGGGNLGPAIVQALLDAKFNVTILSRPESEKTFPSAAPVLKIDYTSAEALAEAFKGQDAVVSVIAGPGIPLQPSIIDAAVKAGVKRFIPSEFGVNTRSLDRDSGAAKILAGKIKSVDHLEAVAAANPNFTWTGLATSLFFDWGLKVGSLGYKAADKTVTIVDSGDEPFTGTNLPTIGLAVVSVLQHLPETANKYLDISSFKTTQNEILSIFEHETGSKWTVTKVKSEDVLKEGNEKLAKGDFSSFINFLKALLFADGKGQARKTTLSNDLLGLPKEDLKETIKASLK